jgi:hypothetical protein
VGLFTNSGVVQISSFVPNVLLFHNVTNATFTVPTNVTRIMVVMWGGGGGGGGGCNDNNNSIYTSAGGGGAGCYAFNVFNVTPGSSYLVTTGSGGAGGNEGVPGQNGSSGSASSFGSLMTANGGGGGHGGIDTQGFAGGGGSGASSTGAIASFNSRDGQGGDGVGNGGAGASSWAGGIGGWGGGTAGNAEDGQGVGAAGGGGGPGDSSGGSGGVEVAGQYLSITNLFKKEQRIAMKKLILLLLVSISGTALAQSSARFSITRGVIAGGGTTFSSSARFQLGSTIAQPLAAVPASSRFSILGGFWIWPAPIIFVPAKVGANLVVPFQTELGKTYVVEYTDTLAPPTWQRLPGVTGNGAVETVTNSAPGVAQRFFRLIEQP